MTRTQPACLYRRVHPSYQRATPPVSPPLPSQQVCDRGTWLFVEKTSEVSRIGGKGLVLLNVPGGRTDLINHDIGLPYTHLTSQNRDAVLAYAGKATATASFGFTVVGSVTAPVMARFSSRGPSPVRDNVLMKPDVTAPGVCGWVWVVGLVIMRGLLAA